MSSAPLCSETPIIRIFSLAIQLLKKMQAKKDLTVKTKGFHLINHPPHLIAVHCLGGSITQTFTIKSVESTEL